MPLDEIIEGIYKEVGMALLKEALGKLVGKDIYLKVGDLEIKGTIKKVSSKYLVELEIDRAGNRQEVNHNADLNISRPQNAKRSDNI